MSQLLLQRAFRGQLAPDDAADTRDHCRHPAQQPVADPASHLSMPPEFATGALDGTFRSRRPVGSGLSRLRTSTGDARFD